MKPANLNLLTSYVLPIVVLFYYLLVSLATPIVTYGNIMEVVTCVSSFSIFSIDSHLSWKLLGIANTN